MRRSPLAFVPILFVLCLMLIHADPVQAAEYDVDPAHASVAFKIQHTGLAWVYGLIPKVSGTIALDEQEPSNSAIDIRIDAASINTGVEQRDNHLRSADFFHVEEYPDIAFKSTQVEKAEDGWKVTGDLTMRGVTKPITLELTQRGDLGDPTIAVSSEFTVNRLDYGIGTKFPAQAVGETVHMMVSMEAKHPEAEEQE